MRACERAGAKEGQATDACSFGRVCEGRQMQLYSGRGKNLRAGSVLAVLAWSICAAASAAPSGDWPTVNRDPGASRHSPLTQITPANVAALQPAWVYHMKPAGAAATGPSAVERQQAQAEQVGGPGQN